MTALDKIVMYLSIFLIAYSFTIDDLKTQVAFIEIVLMFDFVYAIIASILNSLFRRSKKWVKLIKKFI